MYEVYKRLRDAKGLSDYRVAADLGLSRSTFSAWRDGKYELKNDKLQKIADYFGVSLNYMLTGGDSEEGYYVKDETAEVAQEILNNKELSLLFDAAKDADPEDLKTVHAMLLALKRKEKHEQ